MRDLGIIPLTVGLMGFTITTCFGWSPEYRKLYDKYKEQARLYSSWALTLGVVLLWPV